MTYTPSAGVDGFQQVQLGREATAGTAVTCTTVWRGPFGALADNREIVQPEENIGYISPVLRPYESHRLVGLDVPDTEVTFEQIPHIFEAGVKTVTPVQDGTGSDYIYTYPMPTNAFNAIKTYTVKTGDNHQARRAAYGIVSEFSISGNAREGLTVSSTWFAKDLVDSTFDSPTIPLVDTVVFQNGKLYIDDSSGTIGSTQKLNTWLGFTLSVNTGFVPVHTGDGSLDFSFAKAVKDNLEVTLEITFEHDATAVAEYAKFEAEAIRLVRLEFTGPAVATPGTTYSDKTFIIDIAGYWETFPALEAQDGDSVYTATLRGGYSVTDALFAEFVVVNELSALP